MLFQPTIDVVPLESIDIPSVIIEAPNWNVALHRSKNWWKNLDENERAYFVPQYSQNSQDLSIGVKLLRTKDGICVI